MEKIQSIILKLAEGNLKSEDFFIAGINVSTEKGPSKISILLDGDNGVTIDDCVALSRAVGSILEEEDIIESKYTLEVSSPGIDHPLTSIRQYAKNVGRRVKITINDGKDIKGMLKAVSEEKLQLDKEIKKGKKVTMEPVEVLMSDIKKTIVQVSFK